MWWWNTIIISIDTETYEYDQAENVYRPVLNARKFVLGCAKVEGKGTFFFKDPIEMWLFLKDLIERNIKYKRNTYIYAHNAEYDWYAIMKDRLMDKDIKYVTFNPFIAIYKKKGYFLDTMSFYNMSLDAVGKILGFRKGRLPMEVNSIDELKEYIERDVEIVYRAVTNLKEMVGKLGFKPKKLLTSGQLAMTSFMTYCKRNKIHKTFMSYNEKKKAFEVTKTKHKQKVRAAFRGGMNCCFKLGKFKDVKLLDANGLYAYIMSNMEFPDLKTESYMENVGVGLLMGMLKLHLGVARVKVRAPNINLPYLPIRYTKYTVYPPSRIMYGTWTFLELKKALELGYEILEVDWVIRWNKANVNPLKLFVEHLYVLEKERKTKEEKIPIKLLRNNLFGKFAQARNAKDYKIVNRKELDVWVGMGYQVMSMVENKYVMVKEDEEYEPSYVNPIISVLITAGARLFLYEQLEKLPYKDLLYCDTDSVAFIGSHMEKFIINKELGSWKVEARGDAKFLGEKRYYIQNKPVLAGLMRREMSIDAINKEENIETKRMFGLKNGLNSGNLEKVGTFNRQSYEMKPHNKLMLYLPNEIVERNENEIFT